MKNRAYWIGAIAVVLLAGIGFTQFGGCGKGPVTSNDSPPPPPEETDIRREIAKIAYRGELNVKTADELRTLVNTWLIKSPKEVDKIRDDAPNKTFLAEKYHLNGTQIQLLGKSTFTVGDALHLVFCYQLREVYESLRLRDLPPLRQAKLGFDWAMRRVNFDSTSLQFVPPISGTSRPIHPLESIFQNEPFLTILPPSFVLERGSGSAEERALVFLSLVRQLGLRGCVVSVKESKGPRFVFAGVLIPQKDKKAGDIYLFDTRLGTPVASPDGKGIATFQDLKKNPKLLERFSKKSGYPAPLDSDDVAKLQVLVACPFSAMSARMRFLEEFLSATSQIELGLSPEKEWNDLSAASGGNIDVWHRPTQPGSDESYDSAVMVMQNFQQVSANTPSGRAFQNKCQNEVVPRTPIIENFQTKVWDKNVPPGVKAQLLNKMGELVTKYLVMPRRELIQGHSDSARLPLKQLGWVLDHYDSDRFTEAELAKWREDVAEAYSKKPKNPEGRTKLLTSLWRDEFADQLLAIKGEAQTLPKNQPKRRLTRLLLTVGWSTLVKEQRFLLAECWQESAEQLEARIEWNKQLENRIPPWTTKKVSDSWKNAADYAREYLEVETVSPKDIEQHINQVARMQYTPPAWEECARLFRKLNRAAGMQLQRADVLIRLKRSEEAKQKLRALLDQIKQWRELPALVETRRKLLEGAYKSYPFDSLRTDARDRAQGRIQRQIDNVFASLDQGGSLDWIAHGASLRLKKS